MRELYLSSAYWPPVSYFAALVRHDGAVIEQCDTYLKQTYRNRCHIVGPNGVQALTVPVVKPAPGTPMRDIVISDHGNWRHLHRMAIASAYGSSPFYDYFADDINHFYDTRYKYLIDFNRDQLACVTGWLGRSPRITYTHSYIHNIDPAVGEDLRDAIHPKHNDNNLLAPYLPRPYYQVFSPTLGFTPDPSILDLICNMGNEALLILLGIE